MTLSSGLELESCGQLNGCGRKPGHRGCHTPDPSLYTIDWDYNYEMVVVRHVMRGIRAGFIDPEPQYLKRWMDLEASLGMR